MPNITRLKNSLYFKRLCSMAKRKHRYYQKLHERAQRENRPKSIDLHSVLERLPSDNQPSMVDVPVSYSDVFMGAPSPLGLSQPIGYKVSQASAQPVLIEKTNL